MSRRAAPSVFGVLLVLMLALEGGRLHSEVPLPNAVIFGTLSSGGVTLSSGDLVAVVRRGGGEILRVSATFVDSDGAPLFIVRIPLETNLGAPGDNGPAARPGDEISQLLLGGEAVTPESPLPILGLGLLARVDADASGDGIERLFRGDCNGDLSSNLSDAVRVLGFLFAGGRSPPCLKACDVNGDLAVNVTDAIFLLNFLFSGGAPPPPPTGSCRVDQSPPGLSCEDRTCSSGA